MARRKSNSTEENMMTDEIQNDSASEQTDDTDAPIRAAFDEKIGNESEDAVKMAMIQAGATFKNVTRLYNAYMVDAGLAMSKDEKKDLVGNVLDSGDFDVTSQDGFESAQAALVERATNLTDRQASGIIRAWGKANNVEVYKKPAGGGDGAPRGFRAFFLEALEANPRMTKEEVSEILKTHPLATDATRNVESRWQRFRLMANRIVGVA